MAWRRWLLPGAAMVAALLVAVALLVTGRGVPVAQPTPSPSPSPSPLPSPSVTFPLTGLPVDEVPERPAVVVKVSNSVEARPQSGLEAADVLFEELTEGGITRFAAVFHSTLPDVVGPVRSARPVDVQIASGFARPALAYSGARAEVRALLAQAPVVLLTEGDSGFFRDGGTYASHPAAPHNLFVRLPEILDSAVAGGADPLDDIGWVFSDAVPAGGIGAEALDLPMSTSYRTSWIYDPESGLYARHQNGMPFLTREAQPILAANVVVLKARHYVGASGYPETDILGERDAVVLRDGRRYAVRWAKPTVEDPLLLLDPADGTPFQLRPGVTWFHLPDHLPE